jgi:hypothetical protein
MGDQETPEFLSQAADNSRLRGIEMNRREPGGPKKMGNYHEYLDDQGLFDRTQEEERDVHKLYTEAVSDFYDLQKELHSRPYDQQIEANTAGWRAKQVPINVDLQLQTDTVNLSDALRKMNLAQARLDDMKFLVAAAQERLAIHKSTGRTNRITLAKPFMRTPYAHNDVSSSGK